MGCNDGDDYSHNDNTFTSVPLSSCGKGNQAVRLQKLHYRVVRSIILLAIAKRESIFHWPMVTIALVSCCDSPVSHGYVYDSTYQGFLAVQ